MHTASQHPSHDRFVISLYFLPLRPDMHVGLLLNSTLLKFAQACATVLPNGAKPGVGSRLGPSLFVRHTERLDSLLLLPYFQIPISIFPIMGSRNSDRKLATSKP